jgi:hypothetical protein
MDSEKQIEEMARIIAKANGNEQNVAYYRPDATDLYSAGYCKASEVAREFIEAVDEAFNLVCEMTGLEMTFIGKYAELIKKYIGEDTNVPTKMEDN